MALRLLVPTTIDGRLRLPDGVVAEPYDVDAPLDAHVTSADAIVAWGNSGAWMREAAARRLDLLHDAQRRREWSGRGERQAGDAAPEFTTLRGRRVLATADVDDQLPTSDLLVLTLPGGEATRRIVDAARLAGIASWRNRVDR